MQLIDWPGRWNLFCPATPGFDYCAVAAQNGFNLQPWLLTTGGALLGVYMLPNTINGLVQSIDSYPNMILRFNDGTPLDTLVYNSGLGYYEPSLEIVPTAANFVTVVGVDVTLTTGDSCTINFTQTFNGEASEIVPATIIVSTTKQTSFTFDITGGEGVIHWGDGSAESFDATGGLISPSKTYGSSGTYVVNIFADDPSSVTAFDASNQLLTGNINISNATGLTDFDCSTNASVTSSPLSRISTTDSP